MTHPSPLKPKRLAPGATIGIVAPASPFKREDLDRGLSVLHAMGYRTRPAVGIFDANGYLAGSDRRRADQLHAMFADDRIDAVMCARGGYGSLRILPLLDYELIGGHTKPFIGFSDITALHLAMFAKIGLVTFHGPMACTLGRGDGPTRACLGRVLAGSAPPQPPAGACRMLKPGKARGVFLGGNLATLCHLLGTPFAYNYEDCILFIEETGEAPYRVDRMLMQMKLAGCFDHLAGMVLGSFKDCGELALIDAVVRQLFDEFEFPIMAGLDAGHEDTNLTLPLGITAELDADQGELRFLEAAVA